MGESLQLAHPSMQTELSADAHSAPENMVRVRIWPAEFLPVLVVCQIRDRWVNFLV